MDSFNKSTRGAFDAVGWVFLQAVKTRDKDMLDRLLSQNLFFRKYYEQLTDEDKRWVIETLAS